MVLAARPVLVARSRRPHLELEIEVDRVQEPEVMEGTAEIDSNQAQHSRAARDLAEELMDSRRCLPAILSACGWVSLGAKLSLSLIAVGQVCLSTSPQIEHPSKVAWSLLHWFAHPQLASEEIRCRNAFA
jgi:hypothetical protein